MHISRSHGLIFIHNQKTAGVAMQAYLENNFADLEMFMPRHAYTEDGIHLLGRAAWDRHYSFGFVRNPWARLVSWYGMIQAGKGRNDLWQYVRDNAANFDQFIAKCTATIAETNSTERPDGFTYRKSFTRNQLDYFTDDEGRVAVTFIGKFEFLPDDLAKVQNSLGLPASPLSRMNAGPARDYRQYYTDQTREIVARRFEKDINYFGYTFDNGHGE